MRSRWVLLGPGLFTVGFDSYVIGGLLPGISETFGVSVSAAGQGVTAFALCYALSAPVLSVLLARFPARRLLAIAIGLFSVANVMTALSASAGMFVTGRALAGIGGGLFTPVAIATANLMAPAHRRGHTVGTMVAVLSIGAVVGTPVAVPLSTVVGWRGTLGVVAALGFACMAVIWWRPPTVDAPVPPSLGARVRLLADRRVLATGGITTLVCAATLGLYTYAVPMTHSTAALWAWGIGALIGSFWIGHLVDRTGRPAALMSGLLAALVVAMLAVGSGQVVAGFLLWGAAGWATTMPQQTLLLRARPEHAATVVALNGSAIFLGSSLGSLVFGGLALLLPLAALPFASAALLALTLLGHLAMWRTRALTFVKE